MNVLPDWLSSVRVEQRPVPPSLDQVVGKGVLWQASRGQFLLDVPDVARFLVVDGEHIDVEVAAGAGPTEVSRFLRMAPFAALMLQRGALAMHAAAAVPPASSPRAGAVLIAGESCAGKSTLLARLLRDGWSMLADEVAVVSTDAGGQPIVWPTFADVRLWPDAREALGVAEVRGPLASEPVPLCSFWSLRLHGGGEVTHREDHGATRFQTVGSHAYNGAIAQALLGRGGLLAQAGAVARAVPVHRLLRPRARWTVDQLAALVGAAA